MLGMLREIWTLRHFWLALAKHDLKDRYRRSFLGIGWSLIKPAGMTLILTLVFANVFQVPAAEYAPFLFVGLVAWQFLNESIVQGCNAFRLANTYLRVRPVPIAIFPLRVVLSAGVHALIGLGAAIGVIAALHGFGSLGVLWTLAPALAILAVTAWGLACLCGILNTVFSDTQQVAEIALQALFYATPVIYLPESLHPSGWLATLVGCNPFAAYLELIRQPLLHGEFASVHAFLIALAFMAVTSAAAWCAIRTVEGRLVLWL
ncbi:MAG: ABC transporter permease [Planctomycetes bacterium]|nr:ABC transporter permease [Planctomycetota bacterium]